MQPSPVTYEQPLNKQMSIFLRLEKLFDQYHVHKTCQRPYDSAIALESLLRIANIAERPDIKPKILHQCANTAAQLEQHSRHPDINLDKLREISNTLHQLIEKLNGTGTNKFASSIHKNPFLKSIQQQLTNLNGTYDFSAPAYTFWIALAENHKTADLSHWHHELQPLEKAVALVLKLIRENATTEKISASDFYYHTLDANQPYQIVRAHIPRNLMLYPEINVSRFQLAIRFKKLSAYDSSNEKSSPTAPINFSMSFCKT